MALNVGDATIKTLQVIYGGKTIECNKGFVSDKLVFSGVPDSLYSSGDQVSDLTGGWITNTSYAINAVNDVQAVEINDFYKNVGSITYNTSSIKFNHPKGVGYGGIMMQTVKPINFADEGIDSLTINCSTSVSGWGYNQDAWASNNVNAWWTIGVVSSLSNGQDLTKYYHHIYPLGYIDNAASPIQTKTENFSKTVSGLSSLSGSYYVVVGIYRSVDADFSMTLNSITCGEK